MIFIETGGKDNVATDTKVYTVEFEDGGMGHESRKAKGAILETGKSKQTAVLLTRFPILETGKSKQTAVLLTRFLFSKAMLDFSASRTERE